MVVSTPFLVSIFLLGASTGVLLKRIQWASFKECIPQDLAEQADPAFNLDPVWGRAAHADSQSDVGSAAKVPAHSDSLSESPVGTLLRRKELEIALIRCDIQTLRTAIPLLEEQPDEHGCPSDENQALNIKYSTWLNPRR